MIDAATKTKEENMMQSAAMKHDFSRTGYKQREAR